MCAELCTLACLYLQPVKVGDDLIEVLSCVMYVLHVYIVRADSVRSLVVVQFFQVNVQLCIEYSRITD